MNRDQCWLVLGFLQGFLGPGLEFLKKLGRSFGFEFRKNILEFSNLSILGSSKIFLINGFNPLFQLFSILGLG
jgi:hypothetical protein